MATHKETALSAFVCGVTLTTAVAFSDNRQQESIWFVLAFLALALVNGAFVVADLFNATPTKDRPNA